MAACRGIKKICHQPTVNIDLETDLVNEGAGPQEEALKAETTRETP